MRFSEYILLFLSRKPGGKDFHSPQVEWNLDNALSLLCSSFSNFKSSISGKEILDFGCGTGYQAIAMARNGAKYVLGLDTNQQALKKAQDLARELGLRQRVEFTDKLQDCFSRKFDIVISQNSMEHYGDAAKILNDMKSLLKANGIILIGFGPPWFSPYGCHMHFFIKIPWANLIFSEKTIMNVRARFRNDGATKYEEVESGLNKMTVAKFDRLITNSGMIILDKKYECVKGINFLGKVPLLKELFINYVSHILTKTTTAQELM